METDKIEKYLQNYLDDVVSPEINSELVGEDDEPIELRVHRVNYGKLNPYISSFFRMLGVDKNLHIYWNKRPLY